MSFTHWLFYCAPFFPLVTRILLCLHCRKVMREVPEEAAQERDVNRSFILSLAGFSFTAVAGFAVLDATTRIELQLPTWYVLLSFVSYISTLNAQSYKSNRFQNQIATAFVEIGTLSLMLALIALLFSVSFSCKFQWIAATVTFGAWLIDHALRLKFDHYFLRGLVLKL
jgi:hypothetical protein